MSAPAAALRFRAHRVGTVPAISTRIWLRGGTRVEKIPGQALLTGRLLAEGTRRRDWREIVAQSEDLGMMTSSYGTIEMLGVSIEALSIDQERALDWLAEIALEPSFPEDRFEWLRRQALGELESYLDQPDVLAGHAFQRQLYGDHPYGRFLQGDPESLARLTVDDCREFHRRSLEIGGFVAATGALAPEEAEASLRRLFPGSEPSHRALPDSTTSVAPPISGPAARQEIRLPGAEQAFLYLGDLSVPRSHEDRVALSMLGVILGAGAGLSGRMPLRIREQEGLAYHVDVATVSGAGRDPGRFAVFVGTSPETVEAAERAVREELDRLLQDGVEQEELDEARSYLLGRDPFRRETARQWAELLGEAALFGIPADDPQWVRERLTALTKEEIDEAARRRIVPERFKVTVGLPA